MNVLHVLIAVPSALALYALVLTVLDIRAQALKSADAKLREAKAKAQRKAEAKSLFEKLVDHLSDLGWEGPVFPLIVGLSSSLVIASVALRFVGIPPLATLLLGFPVIGLLGKTVSTSIRKKRREMFTTQLTSAFDTIAAQLRQGSGLVTALRDTYSAFPEPLHSEIAHVVGQVDRGMSVPEALTGIEERYPSTAVTLFTAAVRATDKSGGKLAPAMEQAASTLREEQELSAEGSADVAMERMQFLGIVFFVLFLCGSSVLGADEETAEVYGSPTGIAVLVFASVWFSLGVAAIWRMLNSIKGISKKGSKK